MKNTLTPEDLQNRLEALEAAEPPETVGGRDEAPDARPVHTLYGGAHLFNPGSLAKISRIASGMLEEYVRDADEFAGIFDMDAQPALAEQVLERVRLKLETEAVEDYRIDFEDGFGVRADVEEDTIAVEAARHLAAAHKEGSLSRFSGLRIKSLSPGLAERSLRTLDLFCTQLAESTEGSLPSPFLVTLPKIISPAQVGVLVDTLDMLEKRLGLPANTFSVELMVETPQIIMDSQGLCPLKPCIQAAAERCFSLHFGIYDYTAAAGISTGEQTLHHPLADYARMVMLNAAAETGVTVCDGASHHIPVPIHRTPKDGSALTENQQAENRTAIHRTWKAAYDANRHGLACGFYQGWDLHPGQLISRYAALYAFFLSGLSPAAERLKRFHEAGTRASMAGQAFDDAASMQGVLHYFNLALSSGAVQPEDLEELGVLALLRT